MKSEFFLSWPYGSELNGEQATIYIDTSLSRTHTHTQTNAHKQINNTQREGESGSRAGNGPEWVAEWKAIYRYNVICNFDTHFAKWFQNDAPMNFLRSVYTEWKAIKKKILLLLFDHRFSPEEFIVGLDYHQLSWPSPSQYNFFLFSNSEFGSAFRIFMSLYSLIWLCITL